MIFFGERSLRKAVQEFLLHYHGERNHQGLGNKVIEPGEEVVSLVGGTGFEPATSTMSKQFAPGPENSLTAC